MCTTPVDFNQWNFAGETLIYPMSANTVFKKFNLARKVRARISKIIDGLALIVTVALLLACNSTINQMSRINATCYNCMHVNFLSLMESS